jgi:hypothetical protein
MTRVPWAAVGWFAMSILALGMSISAFRSSRPRFGLHAPPSTLVPNPSAQFQPAPPSQRNQPGSAVAQTPSPRQAATAGVQLLKCVVNGSVIYTNNPQECPAATASTVTIFPTRGYQPTKP